MVEVKPLEDVVRKWKSRAAIAQPEFTAGVSRASDWQGKTAASADRWTAGVTQAASNDSFRKGVGKTSTDEWRRKTIEKGSVRFAGGIAAAEPDFRKGISEVLSTIASVTLPARGPKGSAGNYERVRAIGDALHAKKVA